MTRTALLALAAAAALLPASCGSETADFTGLWRMSETDEEFRKTGTPCWLRVTQKGDRAQIEAWDREDGWKCRGRGQVKGRTLHFRWRGKGKGLQGRADIELTGADEVRGSYRIEMERASDLHCTGTRLDKDPSAKEDSPGAALEAGLAVDVAGESREEAEKLFLKRCAGCHGPGGDGAGMPGRARDFTSAEGWRRSPSVIDIYQTLTEGIEESAMGSFSDLTPRQRAALADYVHDIPREP